MITVGIFIQYFLLVVAPPLVAVLLIDHLRGLMIFTTYQKVCLSIMGLPWVAIVVAIYFGSNHNDPRLWAIVAGGLLFVAVFLACIAKMTSKRQKG